MACAQDAGEEVEGFGELVGEDFLAASPKSALPLAGVRK